MKKYIQILFLLIVIQLSYAQVPLQIEKKGKLNLIHSDFIDRNETEIPGAIIYTGNIQVEHNGANIFCSKAYYFHKEEYIKAFGNVRITQGDTINMTSRYAEYNGKTETAFATGDVKMTSPDSQLVTDTVHLNRKTQEAYYNDYGTITNKENILKSKSGRYYIKEKKYAFKSEVTVVNPQCTIKTNNLDFFDNTGEAVVYGPTTITSKEDVIVTNKGSYNTKTHKAKLLGKPVINYKNRKIEGEFIDYDRNKNFAKAEKNVKITDTINKMVARGNYAEVFRNIGGTKKDSMFITKKALISTLVDKKTNDSLHLHGKKIVITGSPEDRTMKAFNNVRFIKTGMSGKCDSIFSNNKIALTKLIGKPVLWNEQSQITGEEIHLIGNNKTEKLDSIRITNQAFIIQKDTIGGGFNQVKGMKLFGKLKDDKLYEVDMIKNTEKIYYMYDSKNELIGIDKGVSSSINMKLENNQITELTSFKNILSNSYPDKEFPENARKLRGFVWRIDEKIKSKLDLFPPEELEEEKKVETIVLKEIKSQKPKTKSQKPKVKSQKSKTNN